MDCGRPGDKQGCQPFVYRNAFVGIPQTISKVPCWWRYDHFSHSPRWILFRLCWLSATQNLCVWYSVTVIVTAGGTAEDIGIVCLDVHKVCLVNGLSAIQLFRFKCYYLYLSYQNLAAKVASDPSQIFNNYIFDFEKKIKCCNYFIWKCVLIISIKCVFIVPPMDQLQSTMAVIGYIHIYV